MSPRLRVPAVSICLAAVLALLASPPPVAADPISDVQRRINETQSRLAGLQKQVQDLASRRAGTAGHLEQIQQQKAVYQGELQRVEAELYATVARLRQAELDLQKVDSEVYTLTHSIERQEQTVREQSRLYGVRLRGIYKFSRTSPLELLLGARNFSEGINQMSLLRMVAQEDTRLVERIRSEQDTLAQQRATLEEKKRAGEALRDQIAAQRETLAAQQTAKQRLLAETQASERQVAAELTQWDMQANDLSATINQLAAQRTSQLAELERVRREEEERRRREAAERARLAAQAQAAARGGAAVAPGGVAAPLPGLAPVGGWLWPLRGTVTTEFGERTFAQSFHTGIDIAASRGSPIRAARDGVVLIRGLAVPGQPSASYGMMVVLAHDGGLQTLYAHLDDRQWPPPGDIQSGRAVKQGQVVGYVGMTGITSGPHVHFETRVNGRFVNPRQYLR